MEVCKYQQELNGNAYDKGPIDVKLFQHIPGGLPVIDSLDDLIRELHVVFESDSVNVEYVHYLMKSYKSNPQDWKKYAKFDRYR